MDCPDEPGNDDGGAAGGGGEGGGGLGRVFGFGSALSPPSPPGLSGWSMEVAMDGVRWIARTSRAMTMAGRLVGEAKAVEGWGESSLASTGAASHPRRAGRGSALGSASPPGLSGWSMGAAMGGERWIARTSRAMTMGGGWWRRRRRWRAGEGRWLVFAGLGRRGFASSAGWVWLGPRFGVTTRLVRVVHGCRDGWVRWFARTGGAMTMVGRLVGEAVGLGRGPARRGHAYYRRFKAE